MGALADNLAEGLRYRLNIASASPGPKLLLLTCPAFRRLLYTDPPVYSRPAWSCQAIFAFHLVTNIITVPLAELPADFRARALRWAAGFAHCAYFEPNGLPYPEGPFAHQLAVACHAPSAPTSLAELEPWLQATDPLPAFGFVTYEVKDEIECLGSANPAGFAWPALHFFRAETWLLWGAETLEIHGAAAEVLARILATPVAATMPPLVPALRPRLARAEYLHTVDAVREDILNGEVYELNLCQEFYAEGVQLDPVDVFERLNAASPAPFAGFVRWRGHYLLCASPERFLARRGTRVWSQPIKGTARRGHTPAEDEQQRQACCTTTRSAPRT